MSFDATLSSRMVDSLGMAASFVMGDWVLRGDFLLTLLDNFQTAPLDFSTEDHYQQLLGIDRIWENWSLGAQIQNDFSYNRNFFGLKIENSFFDIWKPGAMAFVSDKNADKWIQFKNAFQYENWNLNVVVDLLDGDISSQGLFGLYRDNDRVLVEISMTH